MAPKRSELNSPCQDYISAARKREVCIIGDENSRDSGYVTQKHWSQRLRARLRELGWTQTELARRSGVSRELVRKYASGAVASPRGDILPKLSKALNVSVVWLEHGVQLKKMTIPVIGYVGAGEQFFPETLTETPVVIEADDLDLFAVTVRGTSGLPAYRPGEVVVCSRAAGASENQFLNTDCVVSLPTGEAYLKKVIRGARVGTYTLTSYNGPPIENVTVDWVAPVVMVLRKPTLLGVQH